MQNPKKLWLFLYALYALYAKSAKQAISDAINKNNTVTQQKSANAQYTRSVRAMEVLSHDASAAHRIFLA